MTLRIGEAALREAYLGRKLSIAKCAKLFGCAEGTIWKLLKKYGVQARDKDAFTKFSKIPEAALRRAYLEEKRTLRECGEIFGVSATTVRKALRLFDIPVRKGGPIKERKYPRSSKVELSGLGEPLEELWAEGYGTRDIAFQLGVSEAIVRKQLKRRGLWIPYRKPSVWVDWGERCQRCGILFDGERFRKVAGDVCGECERELNVLREKAIDRDPGTKVEEPSSPFQVLKRWRELLSKLSPVEARKVRKEWLDATRAELGPEERRLLDEARRQLAIRGLGDASILSLIAQIGILLLEFDHKGEKKRERSKWLRAIVGMINEEKR
jgi:hypothetical protein